MKRLQPIEASPAQQQVVPNSQSQDHLVAAMLGVHHVPSHQQPAVASQADSKQDTKLTNSRIGRRNNPYDESVVLSQSDINIPQDDRAAPPPPPLYPAAHAMDPRLVFAASSTNDFDDIQSDDDTEPAPQGKPAADSRKKTEASKTDSVPPRRQESGKWGGRTATGSPSRQRPAQGSRSGGGWPQLPVSAQQLEAIVASSPTPVDAPCPEGFVFTVYSGDMSQSYNVRSEAVQVTRGSIKYVDHHARYGPQTRFRFQLCHNYLQRKCSKLSGCSYIHATQLPPPNDVHLNPFSHRHGVLRSKTDVPAPEVAPHDDVRVAEAYPTLPAGVVVTVHAPNAGGAEREAALRSSRHGAVPSTTTCPQYIPSEKILLTVGSISAWNRMNPAAPLANHHQAAANSAPPPVLGRSGPRHCAHYQFKRVCNLGSRCHFIHSKVPFGEGDCASPPPAPAASAQPAKSSPTAQPEKPGAAATVQDLSAGKGSSSPSSSPPPPVTNTAAESKQPRAVVGSSAAGPVSATDPSFIAGVQYAMHCMYNPAPPMHYQQQPAHPHPAVPNQPTTAYGGMYGTYGTYPTR